MVRAVLMNGKIEALGPLPPDWQEGQELIVDQAEINRSEAPRDSEANLDLKRRANKLRTLGEAVMDRGDWEILQAAINEIRRESKEEMRKQMGL
jgi:hypothetical protein